MLDIYTVSFFGHRDFCHTSLVEQRLENIILDMLMTKEYTEFLVGRDGAFDLLAASVIRRMVKKHGRGDSSLILVLPYMTAEYRDNQESFHNYYDEVEVCWDSSAAHFKAAIQIRNRNMVDRSDLVVCCIEHKSGGAYQTVRYAKQKEKHILNIAGGSP